jgi:hypothetical protein
VRSIPHRAQCRNKNAKAASAIMRIVRNDPGLHGKVRMHMLTTGSHATTRACSRALIAIVPRPLFISDSRLSRVRLATKTVPLQSCPTDASPRALEALSALKTTRSGCGTSPRAPRPPASKAAKAEGRSGRCQGRPARGQDQQGRPFLAGTLGRYSHQPDCVLKALRLSKKIARIDLSDKGVCRVGGRLLIDLQLEGIQLQLEVIP